MAQRNDSERDFRLKAAIRAVLWAQGYSTRLDVLLAYEIDPRGRSRTGRGGLTDLDVLGVRLDPGFRVHTAIADCKTSAGRIPERVFWLTGVSRYFGSDVSLLVRSHPIPEHAFELARSLDISVVGPDDLSILSNTYINSTVQFVGPTWDRFFSEALLAETIDKLSRLPESLSEVSVYRETGYWMDAPHVRLQRGLGALQRMSREKSRGPVFQMVFADFVWLYAIALWRACQTVTATGPSRLDKALEAYLSGGEVGLQNLQRIKRSFEVILQRMNVEVPLPLMPPYYKDLSELVVRLIRRPEATAKIARRAEWLLVAQMVGGLGPRPGPRNHDDILCDKLLGDIAAFLVKTARLDEAFLETYSGFLQEPQEVTQEDGPGAGRAPEDEQVSRRPLSTVSDSEFQARLDILEGEPAPAERVPKPDPDSNIGGDLPDTQKSGE